MRLTSLICCVLALALGIAGCGSGSNHITVSLSPGSTQSAIAGQTISATASVANDSKNAGVTWSLSGSGALSAQTTSSVIYTAPSPISASGTATLTATSVSDSTKAATLTINMQAVSISLAPASPQTLDQAQTFPITATVSGDPGSKGVTWNLTGAGTLSGQTATSVTYNAPSSVSASSSPTITATSVFDNTKTATFTVNLVPPPSITTTSLAAGTVGVAYSASLAASNGVTPYTWSVTTGSLPAGLTLSGNSISGTPTAYGTSSFTVQVKDASGLTSTANLSIKIAPAPLSVATSGLPNGIVGQAYSNGILQSAGGTPPVTWSISTGSLPSWASLNASTGAITGTPNAAGTTTFTVKATDSSTPTPQTATKQLNINVVSALSITTSSLPNGTVGSAYNAPVAATGGTTPYTWSWIAQSGSSLPPGLSINSSTGAITGTAGGSGGTYNVTVTVTDASSPQQHTSANYSITITVSTLTVTTTSGNLPQGTVNSLYPNTNLSASGGVPPYSWTLSSGTLPPGLILNTAGTISGTPTTATGSPFGFTVKVTDSATPTANTNTANLSITVNAVAVGCDTSLTGKESLLQGDYTFVQSGFDSAKNPALLGGVFTASGTAGAGNLTAGTIDMNLNAGVQSNLSLTSASKYNLGQDATNGFRGCMTLVTSAGTQHFAFSVDAVGVITAGVASNGHIIGFDAAGPFTSGIIRQANSAAFTTSSITGSWVFGVAGPRNPASGGGKFSAAGVIAFAGGSVSGIADSNTNGTIDGSLTAYPASAGITLSSGPYSISSNGRGTMQFTPSGSASAVNSFLYVVSSSEMLIISADPQSGNDPYFGRVIKQSGSFSNASLTGNHVIFSAGPSNSVAGGSRTELDLVSTPSGNTFDFAGYQNDSGTTADPTTNSGSGTFNVASNGRVTLTCGACGHLPIFYLTSANNGFFLSGDSTAASGVFLPQASGSFTTSSISGIYGIGSYAPDVFGEIDNSGALTFTPGTAAVSGTVDLSSQGALGPDTAVSNTYSVNSSGVVLEPSGCTLTGASANCNNLLIILSPTQVVMMKVTPTNTKPSLFLLEQ